MACRISHELGIIFYSLKLMDSISALLLVEMEIALARFDDLVEKDLFLFH